MANLRSKFFALLLFCSMLTAGTVISQVTEEATDSPVITQGIETAKDGVEYWTREKETAGIYCVPETKQICLDQEARCNNQVTYWTTEIKNQLRIGEQYVVHSQSYWAAKRYLGWAYKARTALMLLYEKTRLPSVKLILDGLNTAIEYAEKIINLLNK